MRIMQLLGYEQQRPAEAILIFSDGLNGNTEEFCGALPASLPVIGGLSSGDPQSQNSYQIAGTQAGPGAMAAAFLRGDIKMGVGYGHGWHPVGSRFRITRSRGFWVRTLDGRPASESYARMFGRPAREWSFPPLNYLTRIYPLGFEQANTDQLLIRSPIRVEADGSFRMNAMLIDGSDGYLLIGSPADCYKMAKQAAQDALTALGSAKPVLAMILVDAAWQTLLEARPGSEIEAIREVLGDNLPMLGGYTLGQIVPASREEEHPKFLNQHIVVMILAERKE